jgi:hypothetical protein
MIAYEFYYCDEGGKFHFLGVLPERRQSPKRITQESVMRRGGMLMASLSDIHQLFFIQVEI